MTESDAILRAIQASPTDDTVRLVAADWIEERSDVRRAEFIRVQMKIAAIEHLLGGEWERFRECTGLSASWCPTCGDCCCQRDPDAWLDMNDPCCPLHNEMSQHTGDKEPFWTWLEDLREKEVELFDPTWLPFCNGFSREWYFSDFPAHLTPIHRFAFVVRRGFVSKLMATTDAFFISSREFGKDPLEHIHLTDFAWDSGSVPGRTRIYITNGKLAGPLRKNNSGNQAHYLPRAFKDLLKGGDQRYFSYGDREYDSVLLMRQDLCQACIAYTRLPF